MAKASKNDGKNGTEEPASGDEQEHDPGRDPGQEIVVTEEDKDLEEPEPGNPRSRGKLGRGPASPGQPMTRTQVAAKLQCSPSTVKRWVREKKLHPTRDPKTGVWWFDAEEVEDIAEEEMGADFSTKQILDASRLLVEQCHRHIESMSQREEKLLTIYQDGLNRTGEQLLKTNELAYARITELEQLRRDAVDQVEAARTSEAERLFVIENQQQQHRLEAERAKALSNMGSIAATYVGPWVAGKLGVQIPTGTRSPTDVLLRQIVGSFTQDQFLKIAKSGALTEDQQTAIGRAFMEIKREEQEAAAKGATNVTPTPTPETVAPETVAPEAPAS